MTSSSGFDPGTTLDRRSWTFSSAAVGDSSDARCTSPSKNAYSESRNAFAIFDTNSLAIGICFVGRDDDDADEDRSTPPAILNALVVTCFWKMRIWER